MKIFRGAKELLERKKIEHIGSGQGMDFFDVAGTSVHLKTEHGTYLSCTCKHCSIHYNKFLCSYKIAVLLYLTKEEKDERKPKKM